MDAVGVNKPVVCISTGRVRRTPRIYGPCWVSIVCLGAKKSTILAEFLVESAFLCIIGGLIGLILMFLLTKLATALLVFPISISPPIIAIAIFISIIAGIIAGIIPATKAARLDPVVAIRS